MKSKETLKIIRALALCALCAAAGVFAGRLLGKNGGAAADSLSGVLTAVQKALPCIYAAVCAALAAASCVLYAKVRGLEKSMDGGPSDDEKAEKIEASLGRPVLAANLLLIAGFFFIASCADAALFTEFGKGNRPFYLLLPSALFLASLLFARAVEKLSFDVEKRLNPARTASLFDFGFGRIYLAQSDEAERLKAYKAGYAGFKAMNAACAALWALTAVSQLIFKTGSLPIFVVCAVWCAGTVASSVTAMKLDE